MSTQQEKMPVDRTPAGGQDLPEKEAVSEAELDGVSGGYGIPGRSYPPLLPPTLKTPKQTQESNE